MPFEFIQILDNLMEYALGLDPGISSLAGMPVAGIENGYLTLHSHPQSGGGRHGAVQRPGFSRPG
ncbi:MAG: hypothetical protein NTV46_05940 [Verrucomicrobia bacterium]|nr:hypothetical protein [Verrucomicrobiota bacterium]